MSGRERRSSSLLTHALAWMLLLLFAAAPALAESHVARRANKGLPTDVAVPSWAAHERVHLLPARTGLSPHSPLVGALSRGDLQGAIEPPPYEEPNIPDTDRPARYHEGGYGVQHDPHVYVIFWGSGWNEGAGPALRTELLGMYDGLSGSSLQGILTQYFDATGRVSATVAVESYTDTESPPPIAVNDAKIRGEVAEALKAHPSWPRDLNSQFVVIPGPGATYEAGFARFCGYHGIIEEGAPNIAHPYAFVPDVAEEPFYSQCIGYDEHADPNHVTSMAAAHEYAESATDPGVDTWFTEEGFEIADMCASGDREAGEGSLKGSWVQGLWDEHRSACSIADAEPPHVYAVTEEGTTTTPREVGLSGQVGGEGLETQYHFEYGSTPSYGTSVPIPGGDVGAGGALVATVSATVEGLPEGIYHYRLVATNSSGTTYGEDRIAISPGFAAQTLPQPPESSEEHEAEGVSCVTSELCVAVGTYFNVNAEAHLTMAETFDGAQWTVQATPNPSEARKSKNVLRGVSCVSASACVAVGYYELPGGGERLLAERWDGSEWSIEPTPSPAGTSEDELRSVACSSASECTAVGYYALSSGAWRTLAERWDGSEWSVQPTPNMSGGADRLMSVSCPASTTCVAVGFHKGSGDEAEEVPVAEHWDGSEWALESIALGRSALYGVSCTSVSACMAVGSSAPAGTAKALAERWDGSQWRIEGASAAYETGGISGLNAVACVSATYCVAGGQYNNPASPMHATEVLGLAWNGVGWSQLAMPGLPRSVGSWRENWLQGLSCTHASDCIGVGDTLTATFDELASEEGIAELEIGAPTATTEAASGVTETAATLAGTVSPAGLETRYRFEYGPTTSYGSSTPAQAAPIGGPVKASAVLTGLSADATVHDRLVASNAAGTSYGADEIFTTGAGPSPPPNPGGSGESTTPAPSSLPAAGAAGSPEQSAGSASGGQPSIVRAYATVGAGTSVRGDAVLTRLSCHGSAGSSCVVTLTIMVEEKLKRGKLIAVSAAVARPARAIGLVRRTVVLARKTVRLAAGASETLRVTLNATGRRLLREARGSVLSAKQTISENGATLIGRVVSFRAPA